jgi:uncharacterized protein (DUF1778 family)
MYSAVMNKKSIYRASAPRPDRYSKKKTGIVSQAVRVTVDDNNLIREAATLEGVSINFWMKRVLLSAARKRIAAEERADG